MKEKDILELSRVHIDNVSGGLCDCKCKTKSLKIGGVNPVTHVSGISDKEECEHFCVGNNMIFDSCPSY